MPGMLTHAYIFKKHSSYLLGSIISDFLPLLDGIEWKATPDLKKAKQFRTYLLKNDIESLWLARGMVNHIYLDKAAYKNKHLVRERVKVALKLNKILKIRSRKLEESSDLFMDMAFDAIIKNKNKKISYLLKRSIHKTDLKRVAFHIANFYNKDQKKIENMLECLKDMDFENVHTIEGASKEYLKYHQNIVGGNFLVKMYGFYLSRILKNNKKDFIELMKSSKESLLKIEQKQKRFNQILKHFSKNPHK